MSAAYQVKGSTIRSKFDFVGERFGDAAKRALEREFEGKGLYPLLTASWYDYDVYVEVLHRIAELHFGGDATQLETVGADSAAKALSTVYQAFVREKGFVDFLGGLSKLHHLFYNLGRIEVVIDESLKGCQILHRDKPQYEDADLYVAAGFYRRAAELHGLDGIECRFVVEPAGANFTMSWQ